MADKLGKDVGLIWEDDTPTDSKGKAKGKSDREKILEAISYFKQKYDVEAKRVLININSAFSLKDDAIDGITISKVRNVSPINYFIFGE